MQLKLAQLFNLPSFATSLPSLPSFSYSLPGLVASASLAGLWLLRRHLRRPTSPFSKLTGVHQWVSCVSNLSEALFEALLWYTAKHCWMLYHAKGSCLPKNQEKCIPVLSHSGEGRSQGADTIWDCSAASQRMRRGNCQRGRFHASFKSGVNQWLGNWRMCVCVFWLYSIRDKKRTSVDSLYLRQLFSTLWVLAERTEPKRKTMKHLKKKKLRCQSTWWSRTSSQLTLTGQSDSLSTLTRYRDWVDLAKALNFLIYSGA